MDYIAAGGVTINTLCSPCSLWLANSPKHAQTECNTQSPEAYTKPILCVFALGLMHAMSHSLGGFTDCPHGECNAIFSPFVVRFNYDAVPGLYEKIGEAMGLDLKEFSYDRKKEAVIDRIERFQHDVLTCCTPCNQGIKKDDIPALVRNTMNSIFLITNPRPVSAEDVTEIFEEALWPTG